MVKCIHVFYCPKGTEHKLTQPFLRMLSLVFGPCPEWQELCAVLDIPLAAALREECDCQAFSNMETAWISFGITTWAPSQNLQKLQKDVI